MNKTKKQQGHIIKFASLFITIILLAFSSSTMAGDITINLTPSECTVSFSLPGGDSCSTNQCKDITGCVCVDKGDFITWTISGEDKFKMKFQGDSPLKDNCGKNFKGKKHKCKVKETVTVGQHFDYDVILQNCANGTDPRIVIKG